MELIVKLLVKIVCYFIVLNYLAKNKLSDIKWKYWEYKHKNFLNDISHEKAIEEMKEDIEEERSFIRIPDASYAVSASAINAARYMMATNNRQRQMAEAQQYAAYQRAYCQQQQSELQRNLAAQQSLQGYGLQQQLGAQSSSGLEAYFGGQTNDRNEPYLGALFGLSGLGGGK